MNGRSGDAGIKYKKRAVEDIHRLSRQVQERLRKRLEFFISQEDPLTFAQRRTKPADAQYRFRVGDYRILFDVEADALVVLHVQHRREVYRRQ